MRTGQHLSKRFYGLALLGAGLATSLLVSTQLAADPLTERMMRQAPRYFVPLPETMPGAENDTPERIELGQRLFFDPRLSINDTQSCATCHRLGKGEYGVDNLPTSPGAIEGKIGDRNTPTVLNAGWLKSQFLDGRAKDLADQAGQPILNPVEMAMPDEQTVVNKLSAIEEYRQAFATAFPDDKDPITYANLSESLAAFQRTLRSPSRFDDFLNGDAAALSQQEIRGLSSFIQVNCVRCHDGALLGGDTFEKLGIYRDYHNQADQGRFQVTGDENDRMVFRSSQLRNVARTGPWFHDGSVETLEEAVRLMAELQLNRTLSDEEASDITAFLGALTDESR